MIGSCYRKQTYMSVNKISLENSHAHLLTCCLGAAVGSAVVGATKIQWFAEPQRVVPWPLKEKSNQVLIKIIQWYCFKCKILRERSFCLSFG